MTFGFSSAEHLLSSVWKEIHVGAKKLEAAIPMVEGKEALAEGLTAILLPAGVGMTALTIERAAFASLGLVTSAIKAADSAAQQAGVDLKLDKDTVQAFVQLINTFKADLNANGIKV